ncbi:glycosyltransferase family 2 protein [Erythrobacter sp.]|uniref:glycosyltransferase family 2 protein n=1 Tax=Erythrobacter sp. TaxID=1042 RepID=UPI002E98FD82|nr:glycosyltransferase family 2 protein [Erythrobacter sp.]
MATPPLDCAVIVPVLNEVDNVEELTARVFAALGPLEGEILFIDDGSSDGTPDLVERIAAADRRVRLVRRVGRRGLSSAVTEGFLSTIAPVVAVIDGDLQHDETILPQLVEAVASGGADLAVGTRYAGGGSVGEWAAARVRISRFATRLSAGIMKTQLSDPMSGFFAIRRGLFLDIAPRLSQRGYKILLDIVASHPAPIALAEVPYSFRTRVAGTSKLDGAVALQYGELLLDKLLGRILPVRLIMFGAIGLVGTVVHMALLWLGLAVAAFAFPVAQALATLGAMTFNYTLNNALTYRDRMRRGWGWIAGWASFCAACSLGAFANVGISTLLFSDAWGWWLSGLAGAAIGSVWNYAATSWLTWRRR